MIDVVHLKSISLKKSHIIFHSVHSCNYLNSLAFGVCSNMASLDPLTRREISTSTFGSATQLRINPPQLFTSPTTDNIWTRVKFKPYIIRMHVQTITLKLCLLWSSMATRIEALYVHKNWAVPRQSVRCALTQKADISTCKSSACIIINHHTFATFFFMFILW